MRFCWLVFQVRNGRDDSVQFRCDARLEVMESTFVIRLQILDEPQAVGMRHWQFDSANISVCCGRRSHIVPSGIKSPVKLCVASYI